MSNDVQPWEYQVAYPFESVDHHRGDDVSAVSIVAFIPKIVHEEASKVVKGGSQPSPILE